MKHCFGSKSRAWIHIPSPSCQSSGVSQTKSPGLEPQHQILFPCQIHCHNLIFSYLVSTQHQVRPQLRSEATPTLNFSSTDSILYFCQHRGITKKKKMTHPKDHVCASVHQSALGVNRMSKRRASNLIKKEIRVDVCYFQLRHSTAICQSQRRDCFRPTVIHCLSKYKSEQLVEQGIHPGEALRLR